MLFFKRILEANKTTAPSDRRGGSRYAVHPGFPVKTMLNLVGRDELGQPLPAHDGEGRDWTGRLINLSDTGARVQMPLTVLAQRDDTCRLKIDVQGYELAVPGHIAHVAERRDSLVLGLALDLAHSRTATAYRQLVELVALGSTLKVLRPLQPDSSGYLVEEYAGEPASRLVVWRQMVGREVAAFEFQLKDCLVRGLAGRDGVECYPGIEAAGARQAAGAKAEEIRRLYQWVVLNLAPAVPADVREFLQRHAA